MEEMEKRKNEEIEKYPKLGNRQHSTLGYFLASEIPEFIFFCSLELFLTSSLFSDAVTIFIVP